MPDQLNVRSKHLLVNADGKSRWVVGATVEEALARAGDGWRPHDPYERLDGFCNAVRPNAGGYLCRSVAGKGTDHAGIGPCFRHGGRTTNHRKRAQKIQRKNQLEAEVIRFGLPRAIDPETALLEELARTAGIVDFLHRRLTAMDPNDFLWGRYEHRAGYGPEGPVDVTTHRASLTIEVEWYRSERRHLAEVAASCLKLNIEERRTRLAENQGALIARVIKGILGDFGLADHPDAPGIVRRHLTALDPSDDDDEQSA